MPDQSFSITRAHSGQMLAAVLRRFLRCNWPETRKLIRNGQVRLDGKPCLDPARILRRGQQLRVTMPAPGGHSGRKPHPAKRKTSSAAPIIRYADEHIVVVEKPAGLTTVRHASERAEFGKRAQRYLPPTLTDLLPGLLDRGKSRRQGRIRAVHRLDRDTSGLLVFARTVAAERHLGKQLRGHGVGRKYLALVRGHAKNGRIESSLVEDRGDGRRGSTNLPGQGKRAVTHVRVLEQIGDFALVECELETGRTHQVRIHLGEQGTPLCGERVYDRPVHGAPLPDASGASRPMLYASFLQVEHPATGKRLSWTSSISGDMQSLLKRLRRTIDKE
jgi:23S rRNA pseudouridine1911/1915/1917 synthase